MKRNKILIDIIDKTGLKNIIKTALKPILQDWSGQILSENVIIYGIRRYLRGASMLLHVDKFPTHIISAILQVIFVGNFTGSFIAKCATYKNQS